MSIEQSFTKVIDSHNPHFGVTALGNFSLFFAKISGSDVIVRDCDVDSL